MAPVNAWHPLFATPRSIAYPIKTACVGGFFTDECFMAVPINDLPSLSDGTHPEAALPTGWRVPWTLLILALPIIGSMVSRTAMSFVDFYMVSQLSTDAQAAIMPAGILVFCFISLGMGTLSAVNTFVSQSLGAKRYRDCSSYNWQGLYLSALYALLLFPLYYLLPFLFRVVGHAPHVQEMEVVFAQICILGLFPSIAAASLSNFFNGLHKPAIGFWVAIIANVFNVVAVYALVFGYPTAHVPALGFVGSILTHAFDAVSSSLLFLGFPPLHIPAMGIAGSAWGTFLATVLQTAILFGWTLLPSYHRLYATRSTYQLHMGQIWRIIKVGFPAGLQFVADIAAFTIFTLFLVGRFGTTQLAASNLAFKFLEISFMPLVGLSIALTASVGKAIGQGRPDYARLVTRWTMLFSLGYVGFIALLYVLIPNQLVGLLTSDPAVQSEAARVLLLCALFQIFDAVGITHMGALRGAGDNIFPALAGVLIAGTVFIPGGYLLAHFYPSWQIMGPWTAATAYVILFGLSLLARWQWGPWEKIDLLQQRRVAVIVPADITLNKSQ